MIEELLRSYRAILNTFSAWLDAMSGEGIHCYFWDCLEPRYQYSVVSNAPWDNYLRKLWWQNFDEDTREEIRKMFEEDEDDQHRPKRKEK